MSRPIYENAETLTNEVEAAKRIEQRWNCTLDKLPRSYEIDFAASRPGFGIVAWIEYKRREMQWGQYPTIMLSVRKVDVLHRFARLAGASFFVVEDRTGEIRFARIDGQHWDNFVEFGGRTRKTRDTADIEPIVKIQLERFKPLT
jgi:hypothetical protein|tara:strand:+ start:271 stop:705 length:435 start_codon:yes stop_codon:yes gene_type:complete